MKLNSFDTISLVIHCPKISTQNLSLIPMLYSKST